jgi:hypothetical protein
MQRLRATPFAFGNSRNSRKLQGQTPELQGQTELFSYCWKRLVLLIMIGDFQNGGNFPSVPSFGSFKHENRMEKPPHVRPTCGPPLYDGVGSVKRHVDCARREGSFFSFPERIFSLSCISTKARIVNPAVESGSTNHLFGLP